METYGRSSKGIWVLTVGYWDGGWEEGYGCQRVECWWLVNRIGDWSVENFLCKNCLCEREVPASPGRIFIFLFLFFIIYLSYCEPFMWKFVIQVYTVAMFCVFGYFGWFWKYLLRRNTWQICIRVKNPYSSKSWENGSTEVAKENWREWERDTVDEKFFKGFFFI